MMLGFVASVLVSAFIGALSIACVRWSPTARTQFRLGWGLLAVGIGLGLSSAIFFLWLFLAGGPSGGVALCELAVIILLAGLAIYGKKLSPSPVSLPVGDGTGARPPQHPLLSLALCLSAGCAMAAFLVRSATSQAGEWDAWMTWNMHARAIFRGGDHWRQVLTALPDWSHPDYPLLLPGSVARMWTYMGRETSLAPAALAMLFTFATVGLLYSSVSVLRSRTQGCLAALLLLGTKFFILHGASQYADVPFGFFLLATLVLLALTEVWPEDRTGLLALAGITAGLSAWTKNEGFVLLLAVLAGYGVASVRARGWHPWLRELPAFAIGLAPVLVMIMCFKIWVAPPNDLMAEQGLRQTAERLLEGHRYLQVLSGLPKGFLDISPMGVTGLLLVGYLLCAGPASDGRSRATTATIVLCLMLAGYAAVLLTAPAPLLATNIRSINRLLLQLWPSALFAYFLSVRTAEEAGVVGERMNRAQPSPRRSARSLFSLPEAS
jgi:hypothetical protein